MIGIYFCVSLTFTPSQIFRQGEYDVQAVHCIRQRTHDVFRRSQAGPRLLAHFVRGLGEVASIAHRPQRRRDHPILSRTAPERQKDSITLSFFLRACPSSQGRRRPGEEWRPRIRMRRRRTASGGDNDKRLIVEQICAQSTTSAKCDQFDFSSTRWIFRRHSDSDSTLSVSASSTRMSSPFLATRKLARRCTFCLRFSTKLSW